MKTRAFYSMAVAAGLLLAANAIQAQSRTVTGNRSVTVSSRAQEPDRVVERRVPERNVSVGGRASEPDRVVGIRPQSAPPVRRNDMRMYNEKRAIVMQRERRELWPISDYAIRQISATRYDSERLDLIQSLIYDDGVFYSDQVLEIARSFTFSSDRMKFLELAYEATVDKCNYYLALDALTFSSDRNSLMKRLTEKARLYSDEYDIVFVPQKADMNGMCRKLDDIPFSSDRRRAALFMAVSGQLDAAQIARLAETFTFESDKVDFLCKAFPYCVTPRDYDLTVRVLRYDSDRRRVMDAIHPVIRR